MGKTASGKAGRPKGTIHLFRGAPSVRDWCGYQETVKRWTLCGVDRGDTPEQQERRAICTEDPSQVTCRYCLTLMRTGAERAALKRQGAGAG